MTNLNTRLYEYLASLPGPHMTGIGKLAAEWHVDGHRLRRALADLEAIGRIRQHRESNKRIVFVVATGVTLSTRGRLPRRNDSPTREPSEAILTPVDEWRFWRGVRFEDAPVGPAFGRAPKPLTHVPTRVAGDW